MPSSLPNTLKHKKPICFSWSPIEDGTKVSVYMGELSPWAVGDTLCRLVQCHAEGHSCASVLVGLLCRCLDDGWAPPPLSTQSLWLGGQAWELSDSQVPRLGSTPSTQTPEWDKCSTEKKENLEPAGLPDSP